jgi:hypothetical protein
VSLISAARVGLGFVVQMKRMSVKFYIYYVSIRCRIVLLLSYYFFYFKKSFYRWTGSGPRFNHPTRLRVTKGG